VGKPRNRRVWLHLAVAAGTLAISAPAFLWWKNSILFVIAISLATQAYGALSAAEAADRKSVV